LSCSTVSNKIKYENNTLKNIAIDNNNMAQRLIKEYEYNKAIEYLKESLKYNIIADNLEGIIKNYIDIGKVYILLKNNEEGLKYYNIALTTFNNEENKNKYRYLEAYIYASIGEGYYLIKDYSKAVDFFNMALDIEKTLNNSENIASIYYNISKIEKNNNNFSKSIEYLLFAEKILEKLYKEKKLNNIYTLSNVYYSLGLIYSKIDKLSDAKKYLFKTIDIDRMTENSSGLADNYYGLGIISEKEKRFDKALIYFLKAKDLYKYIDDIDQYKNITKKCIEIQYSLSLYKDHINSIKEMILLSKDNEKKYYIDMLLNAIKDENIKKVLTNEDINEIQKFLNQIYPAK